MLAFDNELRRVCQPGHALAMTERLLPVLGGALAVDDPGGAGRPFLWAHGLTSSRAAEDDAGLFAFADLPGVRTVRYDARGHGASPGPPDEAAYRWPVLATDLLALLDALGLDRAAVGGASMGCASALLATLTAPERVDRLVLVIPPTAWETRAAQAEWYRADADLAAEVGPRRLAEMMADRPPLAVHGAEGERLRLAAAARMAAMDGALFPHVLRGAAGSDLPDPVTLAAIDQPALVLAWAGDPGHPASTAERLGEALPAAEVHVAEDLTAIRTWPDRVRDFLVA
jgi:3-oxoadipate enol-lactonase